MAEWKWSWEEDAVGLVVGELTELFRDPVRLTAGELVGDEVGEDRTG